MTLHYVIRPRNAEGDQKKEEMEQGALSVHPRGKGAIPEASGEEQGGREKGSKTATNVSFDSYHEIKMGEYVEFSEAVGKIFTKNESEYPTRGQWPFRLAS